MLPKFLKDKRSILTLLLFIAFTGWWAYLKVQNIGDEHYALDWFAGTYGVIALAGGVSGIFLSKKWGGFKSIIGRAILMFSLGLIAQEFGQLIYAYYAIVSKIEVPYPSLGDLGFFGSIPLYIYGAILLGQASGFRLSLRSLTNKIQAFLIPGILLAGSYLLFLRGYEFDWSRPLTVFLDFGYPFGQAIYIAIAILAFLLSRKLLGGAMRSKILFILFALFAQYLADFNFLFQNSHETWSTAGYGDYLYMLSYTIMTFALINFSIKFLQKPSEKATTDFQGTGDQING